MTNAEKAREIANDNCTHLCLADCSTESYFSSENDCYNAAIEAMEWKEEQMIEKAADWLNEHAYEYFPPSYGFQANTANLLVYYFKKAMEER